MCVMERIGVREARQNLSVYLRRVAQGEAFTVTEHGRPVALLAPVPPDDDPLADLIASGRLRPATLRVEDLPEPVLLPADGGPALSEVLQQMRDEDPR